MSEKVKEREARLRIESLVRAFEDREPDRIEQVDRTLLFLQDGWEPEPALPRAVKLYGERIIQDHGAHSNENWFIVNATPIANDRHPGKEWQLRVMTAMVDAYNRGKQAKDRDGLTYAEGLADGAAEERSRWLATDAGGNWPDGWAPRNLWERQSETIQLRLDQLRESETAYKSLQEHKDALALECAVLRKKTAELERRLMDEEVGDEHPAVRSDLIVISALLHAGTVADEHGDDDLSSCLDMLHMLWGVGGAASVRKLLERAVDRMIGALNQEAGADGVTLQAKGEPSNLRPGSAQNSVGMGRTWAPETKGDPNA